MCQGRRRRRKGVSIITSIRIHTYHHFSNQPTSPVVGVTNSKISKDVFKLWSQQLDL
jgi:hypothetical protein